MVNVSGQCHLSVAHYHCPLLVYLHPSVELAFPGQGEREERLKKTTAKIRASGLQISLRVFLYVYFIYRTLTVFTVELANTDGQGYIGEQKFS
jgi:hypothetical protein